MASIIKITVTWILLLAVLSAVCAQMNRRGMLMRRGGGNGGIGGGMVGMRGSMGRGPMGTRSMMDYYTEENDFGRGFQRGSTGGMPQGGRIGGRFQGGPMRGNSMGGNFMGGRFQRGNSGSGGSMNRRQG